MVNSTWVFIIANSNCKKKEIGNSVKRVFIICGRMGGPHGDVFEKKLRDEEGKKGPPVRPPKTPLWLAEPIKSPLVAHTPT